MLRTFRQHGKGYFSNQVNVIAKLDGQVIYNGPVPTEDIIPPMEYPHRTATNRSDILFEWKDTVNTVLTKKHLEISVSNGILILSDTYTNFIDFHDPLDYFHYGYRFHENNLTIWDPLENELIDGIAQIKNRTQGKKDGQWPWVIPDGSTFSAGLITDKIYFLYQHKNIRD